MLTLLKYYFRLAISPALYGVGLIIMVITILSNVGSGFWLMIFLIPQPNLWYTFHEYFLGKDFIDLLYLSIILGLIVQGKSYVSSANGKIILVFILWSYFLLWRSSFGFDLPLPLSTDNRQLFIWKNYAQMIALYYVAFHICKRVKEQRYALLMIAFTVLLIGVRSFRNFAGGDSFDYGKRASGPFEVAGLGSNHLGAFMADYGFFLLALAFFEKDWRWRWLFLAAFLFSLHPLMFSYSRGAYIAAFLVLVFYGFLQKRALLLVALVLFLSWHTILPASVVDRIQMTQNEEGVLENSAASRIDLWKKAIELFKESPVLGMGFNGFQMETAGELLTDTHNFYLRTLTDGGIVGIILFLVLLARAFRSGWRLYSIGTTDLHRGLGLGFMGCTLSIAATNGFGDRWSYFPLGSYFWILWGLTDRSLSTSEEAGSDD